MSNIEMSVDFLEGAEFVAEMAPLTIHAEFLSVELTTVLWLVFVVLCLTLIVIEIKASKVFNTMCVLAVCSISAKTKVYYILTQLRFQSRLFDFIGDKVCSCVHRKLSCTLSVGIICLLLFCGWLKGSKRARVHKLSVAWWYEWFKLLNVLKASEDLALTWYKGLGSGHKNVWLWGKHGNYFRFVLVKQLVFGIILLIFFRCPFESLLKFFTKFLIFHNN
jgi:hypothetical protein